MAVYTDKSEQELVNEMAGYGQHQYSLQEALGVYTGIDPYRFQPVELLNYRNGTSYKTFQEALFNNLKTTLGLTGTHGSNLFSAQELLFKAQEAGIGLNEVVNSYLLFDKFTTAVAAGSVNNTTAEPVGGVRTVTDTNSKLRTESGLVHFASGGVGDGDPGMWYPTLTRVAGRMFHGEVTIFSGTHMFFGWDTSASASLDTMIFSNGVADLRADNTVVGSLTASTEYRMCVILRATGAYYFIKGGTEFPKWTLLFIKSTGSANMLPGFASRGLAVFTGDNLRVPTATWLPTPLAYDTFTRANGALGSTESTGPDSQTTPQLGWTGSTFAVSSNAAVNTPATLGSELLTDGAVENWASSTNLTSWTETLGGTSTVNQETVDVHGGSNAVRIDIDASNNNSNISQAVNTSTGKWLLIGGWFKASTTSKSMRVDISGQTGGALSLTTSYVRAFWTHRAGSATPTITYLRSNGTSASIYLDDLTVKELTLAEMFSSVSTSTKDVVADVNLTLSRRHFAGLVTNLDSASNPQNFVIAYLLDTSSGVTARLDKCVAGVYTNVINASVTYSAGATLRVIKDGTSYQLFYNNAKVGSTSTISDDGIVDNKLHGLFSTYSDDILDNFQLFARGTSNEYSQLDSF